MTNIATQIRNENEYAVELVKGTDLKGRDFFAYLLVQKSNLDKFREHLESKETDTKLEEFGVVLASGAGHQPSEEIWAEVQAKLDN